MIQITEDGIIVQRCRKQGYKPWKAAYDRHECAVYADTPEEAVAELRAWKARDWSDVYEE